MTHRQKEIIEMLLKQAGYKLIEGMYVHHTIPSAFGVKEIFPDESPTSTGEEAIEFAEWANQNYGYVELNKWDGSFDETFNTQQLYQLFKQRK